MEQLAQHPIAFSVAVFGVLFVLPVAAKMAYRLSIDHTPLQWLVTYIFCLLGSVTVAWSISIILK